MTLSAKAAATRDVGSPMASARAGGAYDAAEAATNAIIGLFVSWAATFFVLKFPPAQSAAITVMFFGLSFSRSWILRRIFRRLS